MSAAPSARPRVYLDIDIDGHAAAYARATEFVAATFSKYGLSSFELSKLGGSERARVPEFYAADFAWQGRGRIELEPAAHTRLVIALFADAAPLCAENFAALATGARGKAKGSGLPLSFRGSRFFRKTAGFVQGGDFVFSNGAGGESIWGGHFKDEKGALALRHDRRGLLSMSNSGRNSNGSQFFITLAPLRKLDGKHCVFGEVVEGLALLDAIAAVPAGADEKPLQDIVVVGCGTLG